MNNNIRCTITLTSAVLLLTACGPVHNQPVMSEKNNGIRTIKDYGFMGGNVIELAARECDAEKKKLVVIANTMQPSIVSDTQYPVIAFRCE